MKSTIQGGELAINKVFSNDFVYNIPSYQRPYSWTTEHAGELLSDLLNALDGCPPSLEDASPYFLGSIVLIKQEKPESDVVDGQQRLTTLTILLAALRATVDPEHAASLTHFLYEKGVAIMGVPDRFRLTLRARDAAFFRDYIQKEDGIGKLAQLDEQQYKGSQRNIIANARLFLSHLESVSPATRVRLAQFILVNCFLIVVRTSDFESAYRIFSVLNDRGMDLSLTDILKAELLEKIPASEEENYTRKWEDIEETLGSEAFKELFAHIRFIYRKAKARESVLKEIKSTVRPADAPKAFIDDVLLPYADALGVITEQNFPGFPVISQRLRWLAEVDNNDWRPPAILALAKYRHDAPFLEKFFVTLERLASGQMILRAGINARMERYAKVVEALENKAEVLQPGSPLQLTSGEKQMIIERLNARDFYHQPFAKLVLLRLDESMAAGGATYLHPVISIEHVLPQTPGPTSQWTQWFSTPQARDEHTHRLGNLVLLTRRKNSQASNYDFDQKKAKYFSAKGGAANFALTNEVIGVTEWTPAVIDQRQVRFVKVLKKLWELEAGTPTPAHG